MVADVFEQWIDEVGVDGFNIAYVTSPSSFERVVYLLRPDLVKCGLMWEDYDMPGGALREILYSIERQKYLRDDHYGRKFKYLSEFQAGNATMPNWKEEVVNGEKSELKTNGVVAQIHKSGQVIVDEIAHPQQAT
jgi:hypothetical protein